MSAVFLDTVGLIAVWDDDDQWHDAALSAFSSLAAEGAVLVTTPFVLAECGNALSRSSFRQAVIDLCERLDDDGGLIFPTKSDWLDARRRYAAGFPGAPGLVDEISFVVMRRLGLRRAFTNDRHFANAGFEVLF